MSLKDTRRQRLLAEHFLPFEVKELSKMPLNTPYLKLGRQERRRAYRDARKDYKQQGLRFSKGEWIEIIRATYTEKDWLSKGKSDPWQMLRTWEDRYRDKHPDYESPPKPRKSKVKRAADFKAKLATGKKALDEQRKYPKGKYYR